MKESPIFSKSYDFLRWVIPLTVKFPRQHRFVIAQRLQTLAFSFHDQLLDAAAARDRKEGLGEADRTLAKLRVTLRLAGDMKILGVRQYAHAARTLDEIGRLLGGWLKSAA